MSRRRNKPMTPQGWYEEIADAVVFAIMTQQERPAPSEQQMEQFLQLAVFAVPAFRGMNLNPRKLAKLNDSVFEAIERGRGSYEEHVAESPLMLFVLCYLMAHVRLKVITRDDLDEVLEIMSGRAEELSADLGLS
jgi:hypothetical protein